jgi:DNA-binding response OmpR family regulator
MNTQMKETGDQNIKILIVDDDRLIADILRDLLSDAERIIDVCYDGASALEGIQRTSYDLIVVDLVMPKVGGLEVLKFAKKSNPDVIVIIITGHASLETAITAIQEGAYDYIKKPWRLEEIKIVAENAIERIKLLRENKRLFQQLQDAYHELMVLKEVKEVKDEKAANINFFSSSMPSLHYLYNYDYDAPGSNHIDKLQALSSLRENGMLTEGEYKEFKRHLLKSITLKE